MENKITYIEDEVFRKLTKKQKLELPEHSNYDEIEISKLVLIPTNRKNDGWSLGSFFAYTPYKGWWRPMTYDYWVINTEIENPAAIRYMILKGDFEYGGVNIFSFVDEYHTAFMSYGGQIIIKKKCVPYTDTSRAKMKPFDKLSPKEQEEVLKNGAKMFIRDFAETLNRLKNN